MSALSDVDILLAEAAEAGEAAGERMRNAIDRLVENYASLRVTNTDLLAELKGAAADAYDAAVDFPAEMRKLLSNAPHTAPKSLDDVWESVERLTRHLSVVPDVEIPEPATGQPDDEPAPPPTNFGARVTFADGSGYDIDNIDGLQVHDKAHNTFPFGFVEVPNPDGSASGEWRPGFWSPEDGAYRPFDPIQQPNPNGGW